MSLTDKFDRNRRKGSGKVAQGYTDEDGEGENFAKAGTMRNISFVMHDGSREFFSYADLSRCSYNPEQSQIVLNFRGISLVTIKGIKLESLYDQLQGQIPRQIKCRDKRHKDTAEEYEVYVTEIIISET
jgi:hypothetical protein